MGQVAQAAKAIGYGLDGPSSIPDVGRAGDFVHSFVSILVLGSSQHPIK